MKRILATVFFVLAAAGCATDRGFATGKAMIERGQVEEGLQKVDAAAKAHPDNVEYRSYYVRSRDAYVNRLVIRADQQRVQGKPDEAEASYRRALELDAANARAQAGLAAIETARRHQAALTEARALAAAGDIDGALDKLRPVIAENPGAREARALARSLQEQRMKRAEPVAVLKSALRKPVTLEFRDAPLKSVFEVLSRTSGINFVFDRDIKPDLKVTIYVRNTTIEDAIGFLLTTNQLEKKVLNESTLLVYPNLPAKVKDYQELTIRSFYLANADVKQTLNLIKTVVKTRDVFVDERLNLIVMRDTPDAIGLAEKLIAVQDLAEPEVILEVEVLEIARNRLQELGIRYPTQVGVGIQGAGGPGQVTLGETKGSWNDITRINITDPAIVLNLQKSNGDANLLANPRIRVKNREKAKIHIGDKLPVITTTSTANVGVSESVAYLDVGLKLDVEPNVFLEDEVSIKMGLEVSNVVQQIKSANGTLTYQLGTRNTTTVLRLKNGETQVLAGLISDEERNTADKVPGLGDLPILGRLFGSHRDEHNKTEIVLLMTPYIVRNIEQPDAASLQFPSGTETSIGTAPMGLRTAGPGEAAVLPRARRPLPANAQAAPVAPEPQLPAQPEPPAQAQPAAPGENR